MRNFIGLLVLIYGMALNPVAWTAVANNPDLIWEWVNPLPQGNDLSDAVWVELEELKLWVAVGSLGTVVSSEDGITWSQHRHSWFTRSLNSIAWNGHQLIAVGEHGTIINYYITRGVNGIGWKLSPGSQYESGTSDDLLAITWGGNQFVTVGAYGTILTSSDGVIWSPRKSDATHLNAITWNGHLFVAVGGAQYDYAVILTSPDGITWSHQNTGHVPPLQDITWDGNQFVAVGGDILFDFSSGGYYTSSVILTSPDGITWLPRDSGTDSQLNGITWNGSLFVAVSRGADISPILTSPDGVTWSPQEFGTDGPFYNLYDVTWNGKLLVAVGGNGAILTSLDGITWLPQYLGTLNSLVDVVSDGRQFVAVGEKGTIMTSADGIVWHQQISGVQAALLAIASNGRQFVAVGVEGVILISSDGINWSLSDTGVNKDLHFHDVVWNGSLFITRAFTGLDTVITLTSPDGITWYQQSASGPYIEEMVSNGHQFIALGGGRSILISPDGITWYRQNLGGYGSFLALTWGGNQFIAVGNASTIFTSPDGIVWSQQQLGADGFRYDIFDIAWNGGQFVALGNGYNYDYSYSFHAILTSPDGVTWFQKGVDSYLYFYNITSSGGRFFALGTDYISSASNERSISIIQTSLDGVNWASMKAASNDRRITDIAWNGRRFVVVGGGGAILTAEDTNNSAVLESPQAGSYESGIGLIRGWACHANKIEIQIDDYPRIQAAYGTSRQDTASVCGDDNNGFGLTYNWNLLGDGQHSVQAFVDGAEFGITTFTVTTLGQEFLTGVQAHYPITDFPAHNPHPFELVWSSATQNFVIAETFTIPGSGSNGDASHQLENPAVGALVSGIGLLSGWVCQASKIEIQIDDYPRIQAAYGTSRQDTASVCGDDNNGFGLTYNWNLLGSGPHSVQVFADGVLFGQSEFVVTTLGTKFLTGASGRYRLPDFPQPGAGVTVQWSEAHQNFVIIEN